MRYHMNFLTCKPFFGAIWKTLIAPIEFVKELLSALNEPKGSTIRHYIDKGEGALIDVAVVAKRWLSQYLPFSFHLL